MNTFTREDRFGEAEYRISYSDGEQRLLEFAVKVRGFTAIYEYRWTAEEKFPFMKVKDAIAAKIKKAGQEVTILNSRWVLGFIDLHIDKSEMVFYTGEKE